MMAEVYRQQYLLGMERKHELWHDSLLASDQGIRKLILLELRRQSCALLNKYRKANECAKGALVLCRGFKTRTKADLRLRANVQSFDT